MITAEPRSERIVRPVPALHDLDGLRRAAYAVRRDVVVDLPALLERFADHVLALGAHVCWATTASEARQYIGRVLLRHEATQVLRAPGTDEIAVDHVVGACRADVVETSLDAWIDQLANQAPGHVVATAPHRDRARIRELLDERALDGAARHRRPNHLVGFARERLRDQFLGAEVGVERAELAVAETGSVVLVTDHAPAHLCSVLPPVHVVVVGIDQLTARWDQADLLLALRNHAAPATTTASGVPNTTILHGPRHLLDLDGPRELHVVVLDNGRSRRLAEMGWT
jgi:L-lactate dehydrogenase complex protein LldF